MNPFIDPVHDLPVAYLPGFFPEADAIFQQLWNEQNWLRHDKVPRREYYSNDFPEPYTYGLKDYARTYHPQPYHPSVLAIRKKIEDWTGTRFEVCFQNGYEDQSDQLGWHSDDSPEMDDDRPIAIVSFGVEREIHFREIGNKSNSEGVTKLKLGHGSLCLMLPGMQDTHQHRIPKASFMCGARISLTFRGYVASTCCVDIEDGVK